MKLHNWSEFLRRESARLIQEERGGGIIEVILILVILLAFIVIFKDQLVSVMDSASKQIDDKSKHILDNDTPKFQPPAIIP